MPLPNDVSRCMGIEPFCETRETCARFVSMTDGAFQANRFMPFTTRACKPGTTDGFIAMSRPAKAAKATPATQPKKPSYRFRQDGYLGWLKKPQPSQPSQPVKGDGVGANKCVV